MTPLDTLLSVASEVLSQHFPEALEAIEKARADGCGLPWAYGGDILLARWIQWTHATPGGNLWERFTPHLNAHNLGALCADWRKP